MSGGEHPWREQRDDEFWIALRACFDCRRGAAVDGNLRDGAGGRPARLPGRRLPALQSVHSRPRPGRLVPVQEQAGADRRRAAPRWAAARVRRARAKGRERPRKASASADRQIWNSCRVGSQRRAPRCARRFRAYIGAGIEPRERPCPHRTRPSRPLRPAATCSSSASTGATSSPSSSRPSAA